MMRKKQTVLAAGALNPVDFLLYSILTMNPEAGRRARLSAVLQVTTQDISK